MNNRAFQIQSVQVRLLEEEKQFEVSIKLMTSDGLKTITARGKDVPEATSKCAYIYVDERARRQKADGMAQLAFQQLVERADDTVLINLDGTPMNWRTTRPDGIVAGFRSTW